jgi:CheY-like chemotaxis protein
LNERALAIMERQVKQQVRLTDDLLDLSRITHGGHIDARSDGAGSGTTFVIRLPIFAAGRREQPEADLRRAQAGCLVLVAEDIPDAAEMMRLMIECMGRQVMVGADGVQAVELAEKFHPQIALLDIGMPRMDGYEVARRIRGTLGRRVVLVALTGWGRNRTSSARLPRGSITT